MDYSLVDKIVTGIEGFSDAQYEEFLRIVKEKDGLNEEEFIVMKKRMDDLFR